MMRWAFLCASMLAYSVGAQPLSGYVSGVESGDVLLLTQTDRKVQRIRVKGIDAPARTQAFGEAAKTNLSRLALNRDVIVEGQLQDRQGRVVGKVLSGGQDIGLQQVREGMAWWDIRRSAEQNERERKDYELAETQAKLYRRGLWNDKNPIAPWVWAPGED